MSEQDTYQDPLLVDQESADQVDQDTANFWPLRPNDRGQQPPKTLSKKKEDGQQIWYQTEMAEITKTIITDPKEDGSVSIGIEFTNIDVDSPGAGRNFTEWRKVEPKNEAGLTPVTVWTYKYLGDMAKALDIPVPLVEGTTNRNWRQWLAEVEGARFEGTLKQGWRNWDNPRTGETQDFEVQTWQRVKKALPR